MPDESLFEYYDIHLTGMVVSNREEDGMEVPAEEPELDLQPA